MSHSKRNTSRAVFTAHERAVARSAWSASSARLSRESFLPFGSCLLCLELARDPVACAAQGDLFCRECALANLLAQRKEIKRAARQREAEEREKEEGRERREQEEDERNLQMFEAVQNGLEGRVDGWRGKRQREKDEEGERRKRRRSEAGDAGAGAGLERRGSSAQANLNGTPSLVLGSKPNFQLSEEALVRIAADERAKARKAIEDEKAAKPSLPSFWTPSAASSMSSKGGMHEVRKPARTQPTCPASRQDKAHTYSLHTLVSVHFTEEKDDKTKTVQRICPSCNKILSNASKAMLAKPCGHVLCKSCVHKFMMPSGQIDPHSPGRGADEVRCYVCDADLSSEKAERKGKAGQAEGDGNKEKIKPGLVELRSEGTGFSAGGPNEVQSTGSSAYQY